MKTLYESLLDDDGELINSIDLNNIFERIGSAKSLKEFNKYFNILLDSCTKYIVSELTPEQKQELDKDKKSLYICTSRAWNDRLVIYINRIFKFTSKFSVKIKPVENTYSNSFFVYYTTEKIKPIPFYKSAPGNYVIPDPNIIYKIPTSFMNKFKEWYENHYNKQFLQSYQSI